MKLEMRTLKNIAAAAMTLAVVFGAASLKPVTANAAEASVSASIEEENSYISFQDEAYQNEFLRRVNNERAKAGCSPEKGCGRGVRRKKRTQKSVTL